MKRIISLVLATLLLLSFASCRAKSTEEKAEPESIMESVESPDSMKSAGITAVLKDAVGEKTAAEDADPVGETEGEPVDEPEGEAEEESVEEPYGQTDEESEDEPAADGDAYFELGTVTDGTYENRFLDIGVALDENWTFATEDDIQSMNNDINIMAALINGEEMRDILEKSPNLILTAMFAARKDGCANVSIQFEYLGDIWGSLLDEEDYIELSEKSIENAMSAMDAVTEYSYERDTIEFAGTERDALRIDEVVYGTELSQLIVFMKAGHYIAMFTITSYPEDITDEIAGYFYALD